LIFLVDLFGELVLEIAMGAARRRLFERRVKQRAPREDGAYVLRKGRLGGWLAIGAASSTSVCWVLLWADGAFRAPAAALPLAVLVWAAILFFTGAIAADAFRHRYRLTDRGIEARTLWRTRTVEWSSIKAIESAYAPYSMTISCKDGTSIVLSLLMRGSGTLVEMLLERVPASVLETSPALHSRLSALRRF
jgi:hypothetical protein